MEAQTVSGFLASNFTYYPEDTPREHATAHEQASDRVRTTREILGVYCISICSIYCTFRPHAKLTGRPVLYPRRALRLYHTSSVRSECIFHPLGMSSSTYVPSITTASGRLSQSQISTVLARRTTRLAQWWRGWYHLERG